LNRLSRGGARPVGVFDSGVGGLTVLRALRACMPARDFVYLGDTARLPYGTKSAQSVERYSLQCAAALIERDIGCLVVACNTASASALDALRRHAAPQRQALLQWYAEARRMRPRDAVEPAEVHGIVDMVVSVDVPGLHAQLDHVRCGKVERGRGRRPVLHVHGARTAR